MGTNKSLIGRNLSLCILIGVALIIGILSYNNVWLGDDIFYGYRFDEASHNVKVQNIRDILQSQEAHYSKVNGRYLAHCIVQLFCGIWDKMAFAVCNGLVYIAFIYFICKLVNIRISNYCGVLSVTILALLSFMTKMTPAFQINYVWMFTLVLFWLYIFFYKNESRNLVICILYGVLAILIGNGQEAISIGICGAGVFYWWKNRKSFTRLQYFMAIGFGIGTVLDCLSPGTLGRGESAGAGSMILKIFSLLNFFLYGRAIFVMIAVVLYHKIKDKTPWKDIYNSNQFWWNAIIVLLIFNAFIGFPSNRALFGVELISVIILFKVLKHQQFTTAWILVGSVVCISVYILQFQIVFNHKSFHNKVEKEYAKSQDGIVFADFDNASLIPGFIRFDCGYKAYVDGCIEDYEHDNLAKRLSEKYPGRPEIKVLPSYLRNAQSQSFCKELTPGYWLCAQSKANPKTFYIHKLINFAIVQKEISSSPVDFSTTTYENESLRIKIISEGECKISNLGKVYVSE